MIKIQSIIILTLTLSATAFAEKYGAPAAERWEHKTEGAVESSPAIGKDGTIYFGSDDRNLYALDPEDGGLKWKYRVPTGGKVRSSPAIGNDGTIYFGTDDGYLYALNPDSKEKWNSPIGACVESSPAIGEDGTIYFGTDDGYLYALNPKGEVRDKFKTRDAVRSSPAIGKDGTIYFGSDDRNLYALKWKGAELKKKWNYGAGACVESSPAIGEDGTIYFGADDGYLYAINPEGGQEKWRYDAKGQVKCSPVIGKDGTIYFVTHKGTVYALSPNGDTAWTYKIGSWEVTLPQSSPAIAEDGTIYIGSSNGCVYALNPDDGKPKGVYKTAHGGDVHSSPAIGNDGTIYFGSSDNYFYSFVGGAKGAEYSSWPKFRQNLRNTGQLLGVTIAKTTREISEEKYQTYTKNEPSAMTAAETRKQVSINKNRPEEPTGVTVAADTMRKDESPRFPADLVVSNIGFSEPSGNGALDGDETAEIGFTIENRGSGEAVGVTVRLIPVSGGDRLSYSKDTSLGTIWPGSSRPVEIPIRAPYDVSSETVKFRVEIFEKFGNDAEPFEYPFRTIEYKPPHLILADVALDDDMEGNSRGNSNGIVDPGEAIEMTCAVRNVGQADARDARAKIIIEGQNVHYVGQEEYNLGDIASKSYKLLNFSFWIPKKYDYDKVPISILVTEKQGRYGFREPLNLPVGKPSYSNTIYVPESIPKPEEENEIHLSVGAEEAPESSLTKLGNGLCVIFGIEEYKRGPGATFAKRDACTFYEYAKVRFGIPQENIAFCTNKDATKGEFDRVFAEKGWLANRIEKGKSDVIVYFSGHGAPDIETKKLFLIPYDVDPNYAHTGYSLDGLFEDLSKLGARSVTIFLDACFSGRSKEDSLLMADSKPLFPVNIEAPSGDITVLTASTGEQIASAYRERKHGLFTYYLIRGLQGDADSNKDGQITIGELYAYLRVKVQKEAGYMGREQVPELLSGDKNRVFLKIK